MIEKIEPTPGEQGLAAEIIFDILHPRELEYNEVKENGERAARLIKSLIDRNAIPDQM
jgi:hypothetical protein